ncbi:hypothetical protein CVT25_002096 [Psilocybe cyanescens]|uniref:Uncharacterized protein n=1 Tax=Psilocybe cyanescens TaxID=93625 RepID=A0A409X9A2_PSICY|nr:hypothetical protein CVT25_002096 [Psilocybe cyanescens]
MLFMDVTDVLWRTDTDSPATPVLPGAVRCGTCSRCPCPSWYTRWTLVSCSHRRSTSQTPQQGLRSRRRQLVLLPTSAKRVVVRGVMTLYALPLEQGLNDAATDPPTALEYCDVWIDGAEDEIIALRSGIF